MSADIMVSVVLLTYCHEKFVKYALQSIVNQQVDFDMEIIIADDCSTDDTQNQILDYIKNHDSKYVLSFNKKNLGAKKNILNAFKKCKGKYIAFLEGDDYWTDTEKIEKQVLFLEDNLQYSMLTHNCMQVNYNGEVVEKVSKRFIPPNDVYTVNDLSAFGSPGHTSSVLLRNYGKEMEDYLRSIVKYHRCPGDTLIPLFALRHGDIYHMDEVMSAYRFYVIENGHNWSSKHNYFEDHLYFYLVAKEEEKVAKMNKIDLDLRSHKIRYMAMAMKKVKIYHSKKHLLACLIMLLLMKNKIEFYQRSKKMMLEI